VVFLAKGLHHGHMTTYSCLCQHTVTANLYMTEIAHDVMRLGIEHALLTVLHEYLLAVLHTYILLLVEGVEHAHYVFMYITHYYMTCMPQQTPTLLLPVNVTLNSLSYNVGW